MLALFALPALLGLAFLINVFDDDDGDVNTAREVLTNRNEDPEDDRVVDDEPRPRDPVVSDPLPLPVLAVPDDVARFEGTNGADIIEARAAGGEIIAAGGADTVTGGEGDDRIAGRYGSDVIDARGGNDVVWGDQGNDRILLGAGADSGYGAIGDDTIFGQGGNDYITGDAGNDVLDGGDGNDRVRGGDGNDLIRMGAGDDSDVGYGYAGQGNDTVFAGAGNDSVQEGHGFDEVYGEAGNDFIRVDNEDSFGSDPQRAPDTVDGGAGDDTLQANDEDVLTGGTGADTFRISTDDNTNFGAAMITDFDTDEDVLEVSGFSANPDIYAYTLAYDADRDAVILTQTERDLSPEELADLPTVELAQLSGLTASDIPNVELIIPESTRG